MTYVIVRRKGAENNIIKVNDKQHAQEIVQEVVDGLQALLNPNHLSITKMEDDIIVRYSGEKISTIEVREDDEVDVSFIGEQ